MTCLLCPKKTTKNSGGYFQKNWVGVCCTLPETLTLFYTKICDFPHPISDLIKNLIPRPEALEPGAWPERVTSCYGTYTVVGVNIKREMVLSPNDEEVANSSKNILNSRQEGTNHTLFQKPKCLKSDQQYKLHHTGNFRVLGGQNSNDNLVVTVEPNSPIGPKGSPNHIGYNSCQVMLTSVRELSWWEGSRLPWNYRLS